MALSRRFTQRATGNIWPGFVDAMTALLLVLMFVLTIFMVVQSVLSERILDQDDELDELTLQISDLADALGLERRRAETLAGEVGTLTATLDEARSDAAAQEALIATLTSTIATQRGEIADRDTRITAFEDRVAALLTRTNELEGEALRLGEALDSTTAERDTLAQDLDASETARAQALSEAEALNLALAQLRTEIDTQTEAARLAAARAEAFEALVSELEERGASRETRLATLAAELRDSEETSETLSDELSTLRSELDATEAARLAELAAAEELRQRLSDQDAVLTEAEKARLAEAAAAEALRERLATADAELTAMTLALEERRQEAEDTLTLLAAAEAARARLETERADLAATRAALEDALSAAETDRDSLTSQLTDAEKTAALLAVANQELDAFEAQSAEDARRVTLLNEQVAALRSQLGGLQTLLDDSAAQDAANQVQIQALGQQLNTALAQVASEQRARAQLEEERRRRLEQEALGLREDAERLALYRSEFFGRLRDLLGGQEGVRIEGDRFVFSSEVLFDRGAVDLSLQGRQEVGKVADILRRIAGEIPPELDWVIRVDGHTDDVPVTSGGKYADNWELSQGRALSVVRYMIDDLGIPPDRLLAAGFGEFNPINPADSEEARAQNRRIELKFTEK